MPELPDLTVFAENLDRELAGNALERAVHHRRGRLNVAPEVLSSTLAGAVVQGVERWGKEISFSLSHGHRLLIHLMLSGGFSWGNNGRPPSFPVLELVLEDGRRLWVQDPKGLVSVALDPELREEVPDALAVDHHLLQELLSRKPKALLKAFLIDQKVMRGIGNAYADEILWQARLSPRCLAGRLPPPAVEALAAAIPEVLNKATEHLRSIRPGLIAGEVRDFLAVHNPGKRQSPTGQPIRSEVIASKKTYFTDEQQLYV